VCDTLARLDSKQTCLRNVHVCLFYPAASLFGDAPRKYSEASVHPAGANRQSLARGAHERLSLEPSKLACRRPPLLHAPPRSAGEGQAEGTAEGERRGRPASPSPSPSPGRLVHLHLHHQLLRQTHLSRARCLRASHRLPTHWSRQCSEPGDQGLSAKHPDPRLAQLARAALITFLAHFMLRAGYS
jgi:hypothetical protein